MLVEVVLEMEFQLQHNCVQQLRAHCFGDLAEAVTRIVPQLYLALLEESAKPAHYFLKLAKEGVQWQTQQDLCNGN